MMRDVFTMLEQPAMRVQRSLTLTVCLWLAACGSAPASRGDAVAPTQFTLQEQRFESRGCLRAGEPCAEVLLRYPEFARASAPALVDAMHGWIEQQMSIHGIDGQPAESPRVAARSFIEAFERHVAERPTQEPDWFDHRRVELLYEDAQVVSLTFQMASFTGGAHPMSARRLASFDRSTGERLTLDAAVRPSAVGLLTDLVTRSVRTEQAIPPELDLADAGFLVEDNRIAPTDNFAVTATGWRMHYDPYEIAPYAMGPIEVELSFDDIENIALPGTPAAPRTAPLIADSP